MLKCDRLQLCWCLCEMCGLFPSFSGMIPRGHHHSYSSICFAERRLEGLSCFVGKMQGMDSIARETPWGQFSSSGLTLLALLSLAQSRDSVAGLDCPSRAQGCPHPGCLNSRMATMQKLLADVEWCLSITMGCCKSSVSTSSSTTPL